jgi:hypothetical protein
MLVPKPSFVWFSEKWFPQKISIDEISICHSSNGTLNAIPDQVPLKKIQTWSYLEIRSNYRPYSSRLEVVQL